MSCGALCVLRWLFIQMKAAVNECVGMAPNASILRVGLLLFAQKILEAEKRFERVLPERRADAEQHRRYQPSGHRFDDLLCRGPLWVFQASTIQRGPVKPSAV